MHNSIIRTHTYEPYLTKSLGSGLGFPFNWYYHLCACFHGPRCSSAWIDISSSSFRFLFSSCIICLALSSMSLCFFSPSSRPASGSLNFLPNFRFTNATYPTSLALRVTLSICLRSGDIVASICAGGPFLSRRMALRVSSPTRSLSFSLVLLRIFSRRASKIASTILDENGVFARSRSSLSFWVISWRQSLRGSAVWFMFSKMT